MRLRLVAFARARGYRLLLFLADRPAVDAIVAEVDLEFGRARERALDQGRKVIAGVNNRILWNEGGDRSRENHFVVVTGIDSRADVVHLNDSGIRAGRDEQVSLATFEAAWATSDNFVVMTG